MKEFLHIYEERISHSFLDFSEDCTTMTSFLPFVVQCLEKNEKLFLRIYVKILSQTLSVENNPRKRLCRIIQKKKSRKEKSRKKKSRKKKVSKEKI